MSLLLARYGSLLVDVGKPPEMVLFCLLDDWRVDDANCYFF